MECITRYQSIYRVLTYPSLGGRQKTTKHLENRCLFPTTDSSLEQSHRCQAYVSNHPYIVNTTFREPNMGTVFKYTNFSYLRNLLNKLMSCLPDLVSLATPWYW